MLPERLVIKNFLNFADVDIDFSDIRKALILGVRERNPSSSNGSGKSNLLRSIPWCIWGINPEAKTMDHNIKWGSDSCSVRMFFSHNNKKASITRTRNIKTKSSTLDFMIDGVVSNGNSIDETNQRIISFLNLDYNAYVNSVYINQNDLFSLANSRDKNESRELLERVLGLNEYDEYFEATKISIEELEAKKASVLDENNAKQSVCDEILVAKEGVDSIKKDIQDQELKKTHIQKELESASLEYESVRGMVLNNESAAKSIQEAEMSLGSMRNDLAVLIDKANRFKQELDKKKVSCSEIIDTHDAIAKEDHDLKIRIVANKLLLDRVVEINAAVDSITSEKDDLQSRASSTRQRLGILKNNGDTIKADISDLENKMANPSVAIGSQCDFCFTDINKDTVSHYLNHISDLISDKTKTLDEYRQEAGRLIKTNEDLTSKINVLSPKISELHMEKEDVLLKILSEKTIQYQQNVISNKLDQIETAKKDLLAINESDDLNKWKATIKTKRDEIDKKTEDISVLKNSHSIDDAYQQIVDRSHNLKTDISDINSNLGKIDGMIFVLNSNLKNLKDKIGGFDIIKQEIESNNKDIVDIDSSISTYNELLRAFSPRGIRYHILGTAIEDLEKEANAILPTISSGNLSITFETKKEVQKSKTGQTEKLTFDAYIHDGQKTLPFNMYSGGEQLRISFVIRVALSKLLLKRANSELEFLILDESLSPLDKEGIELMIPTINALQSYFKKIIVITHRDDVKQYFDEIITVRRDKYTSTVDLSYYETKEK